MRDPITAGGDRGIISALLECLTESGFRTTADLARQLGVSEALVAAIIADLERRGYLRTVTASCAAYSCSGCPLRESCLLGGVGRGWMLASPDDRPASTRPPPTD